LGPHQQPSGGEQPPRYATTSTGETSAYGGCGTGSILDPKKGIRSPGSEEAEEIDRLARDYDEQIAAIN
jgi:hypothetical protein